MSQTKITAFRPPTNEKRSPYFKPKIELPPDFPKPLFNIEYDIPTSIFSKSTLIPLHPPTNLENKLLLKDQNTSQDSSKINTTDFQPFQEVTDQEIEAALNDLQGRSDTDLVIDESNDAKKNSIKLSASNHFRPSSGKNAAKSMQLESDDSHSEADDNQKPSKSKYRESTLATQEEAVYDNEPVSKKLKTSGEIVKQQEEENSSETKVLQQATLVGNHKRIVSDLQKKLEQAKKQYEAENSKLEIMLDILPHLKEKANQIIENSMKNQGSLLTFSNSVVIKKRKEMDEENPENVPGDVQDEAETPSKQDVTSYSNLNGSFLTSPEDNLKSQPLSLTPTVNYEVEPNTKRIKVLSDSPPPKTGKDTKLENAVPIMIDGDDEEVTRSVIRSMQQREVLLQFSSEYIDGHRMKFRSLINNQKKNILASSGLDGSIKFWLYDDRTVIPKGYIDSRLLKTQAFPNAMEWTNDGNECVLVYSHSDAPEHKQMIIINVTNYPKAQTRFIESQPHSKSVNTVSCFPQRSDHQNLVVTGGDDHQVILWDISKKKATTTKLHKRHTASVQSVSVHSDGHSILSGSSDRKLFSWNMERENVDWSLNMESYVCSIRENPCNDSLLLLCQTSVKDQLWLRDIRAKEIPLKMSWKQDKSPSRWIEPSWASGGFLIACGSTDPVVNLWDIRYLKCGYPSQTFPVHNKRVLRTSFISANRLLTVSSDKTLGVHRYVRGFAS